MDFKGVGTLGVLGGLAIVGRWAGQTPQGKEYAAPVVVR